MFLTGYYLALIIHVMEKCSKKPQTGVGDKEGWAQEVGGYLLHHPSCYIMGPHTVALNIQFTTNLLSFSFMIRITPWKC